MSDLRDAIGDYLRVRRSLGFALRDAEWLPADFADFLQASGCAHVTTEHALAWATRPAGTHPHWWHQRLAVVGEFARYLATIDPLAELPAPDLLPACYSRRSPYRYSEADIAGLMRAARSLSPPRRAATYQTPVGLLAVSGLRIGEAIRLDQDDLDDTPALLVGRHSKHNASRQVPLHQTTVAALRGYGKLRDQHIPHPAGLAGLHLRHPAVPERGQPVVYPTGPPRRPASPRRTLPAPDPRPASQLRGAPTDRVVPARRRRQRPAAAAVRGVGHVNPASTYRYLQAAPELLAPAAQRLPTIPGGSQ
jgi:integrase/recombinase XerD